MQSRPLSSRSLARQTCTMHLSYLFTATLLPLGLLAAPSSAEEELDRRAIKRPQTCGIVGNANTVKCREGPGTKWDVRTTLRRGTEHDFWCVYSKECITIGGSTNCGWHYIPSLKCFVNGHYTSGSCTRGKSKSRICLGGIRDTNSVSSSFGLLW
ncbi:hypothetical protein B0T14DRAFT_86249 [Immersiella caudata]|uniref:Uncharacterized protein n=1 Tax=Immersiella caudata TaxID=314043 RepID=A0AA39XI83_9PEZI|nr:hypothetical protein B0T14DRAFT_86249 [Immersiella caudata]